MALTPSPLRTGLAVALLLSTVACSTLPTERPEAGRLPDQWMAAAVAPSSASLTDWWSGFQDPLLDRLVSEAVAEGGGPRQALLRVREARANSQLTLSPYLPSLSAGAQAQGTRVIEGVRSNQFSSGGGGSGAVGSGGLNEKTQATGGPLLRATWEIPLFGRIESAIFGSRANDLFAAADLDGSRAAIAADVADAYVTLRAAQNQRAALAESVAAAEQLAQILERGADGGLFAPADAADARRQAESVRSQAPDVEIAIVQATNALSILRGYAPGADTPEVVQALRETKATPSLPLDSAPAAPADLVRLRPDIRLAEARALLAAASLGSARQDMLPQINLTGSIISTDNLIGSQLPGRVVTGELSPVISIPLFDWGRRQANVDINDSRFQQSLIAYRDTVNQGVGEAQLALTQLVQGSQRLDAARKAEAAAERNTRGVRASQEAGIASVADRLRADQQLIDARLRRISAEEAQARAGVAVYRAFGGGPPALSAAAMTNARR